MFFIGSGLVILGIVAFIILPRGEASPSRNTTTFSVIPTRTEFPAPKLELQDLEGNKTSLEDLRGQVVLVNNWATWCPPCREEMPDLEAYYQKHKDNDFTLVAIDAGDPLLEVAQFVDDFGLSFSVWLDPNQDALRAFRNSGLPNSYVIDKQGVVRLAWTGAIKLETLEQYVTPLLEE
jgi:cytochrome c biogenesis protein CcmG, thiol:disulfide interchange protein DsbE